MDITKALQKSIENGIRLFEKSLTRPQGKAVKTVIRGIIRKTTTILSSLNETGITNRKFREKISFHLGKIDLVDEIEAKAYECINKTDKGDEYMVASYDESDVFKPEANKMEGLKYVRDGSTGLTGNGYIFRGVNINGISAYSRLEVANETCIDKNSHALHAMDTVFKKIRNKNLLFLIDRGGDVEDLMKELLARPYKFIIRGKKNRQLVDNATQEKKKVTDYALGRSEVVLGGGTVVYMWRVKREGYNEPIILYTNVENMTGEQCLQYYLKRWKVEEDFNKMKDLGLEDVRLFSMKKIQNILSLIQFIIVLSQDLFNEVLARKDLESQGIYKFFEKFCHWKSTTINPQSFIRFIAEHLVYYRPYVVHKPDIGLFSSRELKKLGPI